MTITQLGDHRALFKRAVRAHQEVIEIYEELVHELAKSDPAFVQSARIVISAEKNGQATALANVKIVGGIINRVERELNGYRGK